MTVFAGNGDGRGFEKNLGAKIIDRNSGSTIAYSYNDIKRCNSCGGYGVIQNNNSFKWFMLFCVSAVIGFCLVSF